MARILSRLGPTRPTAGDDKRRRSGMMHRRRRGRGARNAARRTTWYGCNRRKKAFLSRQPQRTRAATETTTWSGRSWRRGVRMRCLWPREPKEKMLLRPAPQLPPQRTRLRLARALRRGCAPHGGRAVGAGLEKTQASGIDPTVSIIVVCFFPILFRRALDVSFSFSPSRTSAPIAPELAPTNALRVGVRDAVCSM
jgi:hypothetical protein